MLKQTVCVLCLLLIAAIPAAAGMRAGVAAVPITPFGQNIYWKHGVTPSGVWGDDEHHIYLAGFGDNRLATGKHDDLWARVLVLQSGKTKVALVALDFIGYYQSSGYYGMDEVQKMVSPDFGFTKIIVSSTHNHEGPDTIGLWGPATGVDGKFPDYLKYVDRQIAKAIMIAGDAKGMVDVDARFGATDPAHCPSLQGLQVRTTHRPPDFYDEELRAMQLMYAKGPERGKVLATMINWNTHPESMESSNHLITSDFPHYVREAVEKKYGGTAVYFSGDLGAVEVVGDAAALGDALTETIDGRQFPLDSRSHRPIVSFERTQAIGEAIAKGVFQALQGANIEPTTLSLTWFPIAVPVTNPGFIAMQKAGVLTNMSGDAANPRSETTLYHIVLGPAEMITVPGEIFPEIIYGVEAHRRTDCPEASTGRPYEPAVAPLMKAKYKFILGLSPDELGYIVPQYDFTPFPPAQISLEGRTPDACKAKGVPNHYHETNSSSYRMAPAIACGLVKLLGGDPFAYQSCKDLAPPK